MPGYDQTGPMGAGPMTGGGRGMCTGAAGRGFGRRFYQNRGMNRGGGYGLGFGRRMMGAPRFMGPGMTTDAEIERLKMEAEWIQRDLAAVNQQIETLEKTRSKE